MVAVIERVRGAGVGPVRGLSFAILVVIVGCGAAYGMDRATDESSRNAQVVEQAKPGAGPDQTSDLERDGIGPAALAADRINRKAQFQDNDYAGTAVDEAAGRVDLWWQGPVDPDVQKVIDDVNAAGEVTVAVHDAARSRAEMRKIGATLHGNERLAAEGVAVTGVSAPPDQSGFDIYISPAPAGASEQERADRREKARKIAAEQTGVPVLSVTESQGTVPLAGPENCEDPSSVALPGLPAAPECDTKASN